MLRIIVDGTAPVCVFSPRPFWFQQALCWALDVQCCRQEGMVAAGNRAAARFGTCAVYAIVNEEIFNVYFGAVDQEVEDMLSVRSPDAFQVCKLQVVFLQDLFFEFLGYSVLNRGLGVGSAGLR